MKKLADYVMADKDIVGGVPVFKGTRVTVQTLFDHLEESSIEDFLDGHPTVSKSQAEAVIELAAENLLVGFTA